MILLISDIDMIGSGYKEIALETATQLTRHGIEVVVLGNNYDGSEHHFPFSIIPVSSTKLFAHAQAMINNFLALAQRGDCSPIEALIVAIDIPQQEVFMAINHKSGFNLPYIGIFPIESGPLCNTWAGTLAPMDARLVISKFGQRAIEETGLTAVHYPVGVNAEAWKPPSPEERTKLRRAMGFTDDHFVVLTVADNQERKNLSSAALGFHRLLKKNADARWVLVTRINSPVGWKLDDPPFDLGDAFIKHERGLDHKRLWALYATADAFLLTSKAEGLCMPVLEAMSMRVPVVATSSTAVEDHLYAEDGSVRGFPIKAAYKHIDAWGNSERVFADPKDVAKQLAQVYKSLQAGDEELGAIVDRAQKYALSRTWDHAGDVLVASVGYVIKARQEAAAAAAAAQGKREEVVVADPEPKTEQEAIDG